MSKSLRLDRLLANMGYGSRNEVQSLVYRQLVTLDGEALDDPSAHIPVIPDLALRMQVDGLPLDPPPGMVLMLNKPLGVTCSHKDAGPLVYNLLPERWRRRDPAISTIGRLDKETSGLLLLTDDGQLLHRVISPRHKVAKRYRVMLDRPWHADAGKRERPACARATGSTWHNRSAAHHHRRALPSGTPHVRRRGQPCERAASRPRGWVGAARKSGSRHMEHSGCR